MFIDLKCPSCGEEKIDEWVKTAKQEVKCPKCDTIMEKKLGLTNNQTSSRRIR